MPRKTLALAAFLLFVPLTAEATIARAVQFEEKVEHAAGIVIGKCVAQTSRWDSAHNWILTYSTFRIEKTLKGMPAQEITIVTPGGTVDNIAQEIIGVPRFREGEEHVLFVRHSQAGPTVMYLEQGDYRVVANGRGERMVAPAVSSAVLVDTGRGTAVTPEAPRTLRDFEGSVRDTIRRREANRMEMIERKKKDQASLRQQVRRNRELLALALIGALLATWQFTKRS
ncbi:MAG TPA: hypothetical protein VGQ36_28845 [Thermoanaerobaculia bacterium]|jgi:hypothetical protein|nr:hypothetical protein [Thermoanaerobaculia bacterium]